MRRNLFRGKTNSGKWVQGYFAEDERDNYQALIICNISVDIDERNSDILSHEIHVVDPSTLGQCTGLKDKNGKSIFEGDILRCYRGGMINIDIAVWDEKYSRYIFANKVEPPRNFSMPYDYNNDGIEIVGNIHDGEFAKGEEAE